MVNESGIELTIKEEENSEVYDLHNWFGDSQLG